MSNIGIMGGTFDPIHIGHKQTAIKVAKSCGLDAVLFIPSHIPPHKKGQKVTSAGNRIKMVELAIKDEPQLEISLIEANREGFTYTIDTMKQLTKENPKDRFYYIIGADVVLDLLNWRCATEVFKLCAFKAVYRPGYEKEKLSEQMELLQLQYGVDIELVEVEPIAVSSSEIRDRICKGESIDGLVNKRVEEFIYENGLYK